MNFVSFLVLEGSEYPQGIRFTDGKSMYDLSVEYGSKFNGFADFLNDISSFCGVSTLIERNGTLATIDEFNTGVFCDCVDGDVDKINNALSYLGGRCIDANSITLDKSRMFIPRVTFDFSKELGFTRTVNIIDVPVSTPIMGLLWSARVVGVSVDDNFINVEIEEVRSPANRLIPNEEVKYTIAVGLKSRLVYYYNKLEELSNNEMLINASDEILIVDKSTFEVKHSLCKVSDINEYLSYIIRTANGDYFIMYKNFKEYSDTGVETKRYYSCYKQSSSDTVKLFSSRRDAFNILDSTVSKCLYAPIELSGVRIEGAYEVVTSADKYMFN